MYSDARGSVKITSARSDGAARAALQLPVDRPGPPRVGRGDPRARGDPRPARVRAVQRRRDLARAERSRPTSEILDWVARDAETALHPSCTCRMGIDETTRWSTRATMRVHGLDGLRVVDASSMPLRHQRQHLRAGDDARREGRRPDPRQQAPPARTRRVLPAPTRAPAPDSASNLRTTRATSGRRSPARRRRTCVGAGRSWSRMTPPITGING